MAIGIQRVIDDPLGRIDLVIVLEAEMAESLGYCIQPGCLGLMPQGIVGVGAVDDPGQEPDRRITVELVFLHHCVERAEGSPRSPA